MLDRNDNSSDNPTRPRCKPIAFEDVAFQIDGVELIHKINCTLEARGKTVVLGPNGAGKSLFLRLMAGLIEPSSGRITGGAQIDDDTQAARDAAPCMALVFQNPVILRRTAYENIAFVLHHQKVPADEVEERVQAALLQARLSGNAHVPARNLSGGEQQRLALSRTLIINPHALLLDEPTASLDPLSTSIVEEMIEQADRTGTKIVLVSHDIKQAKRLADDILFIHEGRVLVHKSRRDFFDNPGSLQAQAYLDGRVPQE